MEESNDEMPGDLWTSLHCIKYMPSVVTFIFVVAYRCLSINS
jgi:hypothetical protein